MHGAKLVCNTKRWDDFKLLMFLYFEVGRMQLECGQLSNKEIDKNGGSLKVFLNAQTCWFVIIIIIILSMIWSNQIQCTLIFYFFCPAFSSLMQVSPFSLFHFLLSLLFFRNKLNEGMQQPWCNIKKLICLYFQIVSSFFCKWIPYTKDLLPHRLFY